jgi:hypothetical protein
MLVLQVLILLVLNVIAANSFIDWYGQLRLDTADYLVGGASANTSLTFQAEAEIGVV